MSKRFLAQLKRQSELIGPPNATLTPVSKRQRRRRAPSLSDQRIANDNLQHSLQGSVGGTYSLQNHRRRVQSSEVPQSINEPSQHPGTLSSTLEHDHERHGGILPAMQNPLASGPSRFVTDPRGRRRMYSLETNPTCSKVC